jgi:hypothetical protein
MDHALAATGTSSTPDAAPPCTPPIDGRHRRRGRRDERSSSEAVARQLDEIIERLHVTRPYTLYRHLAAQTGMHPTTILRVHQGRLGTAHALLVERVEALLKRVRAGESLPFEQTGEWTRRPRSEVMPGRVASDQIRERIEAVLGALGQDEHQFLYRYLADRAEVHPTTVLRYHRGELRTAPRRLLSLLDDLLRRISTGEVVSFCRSNDGPEMVVRERVLEVVDTMFEGAPGASKARVFRALDDRLDLKPGTLARIYYDRKLRFVRADIHVALQRMVQCAEYDPCRVFAVGERVNHHLFGVGVVREKVHKNKVLIEFHDGRKALLSEAVPQDPFLHLRSSGWGTQPHAGMGTSGLAN